MATKAAKNNTTLTKDVLGPDEATQHLQYYSNITDMVILLTRINDNNVTVNIMISKHSVSCKRHRGSGATERGMQLYMALKLYHDREEDGCLVCNFEQNKNNCSTNH